MSATDLLEAIESILRRILGFATFKQISAGSSYSDSRFYAIRALGGDITFDATTSDGDNLTGATVQQDADIVGEFESIDVDGTSGGSAIIYIA